MFKYLATNQIALNQQRLKLQLKLASGTRPKKALNQNNHLHCSDLLLRHKKKVVYNYLDDCITMTTHVEKLPFKARSDEARVVQF